MDSFGPALSCLRILTAHARRNPTVTFCGSRRRPLTANQAGHRVSMTMQGMVILHNDVLEASRQAP